MAANMIDGLVLALPLTESEIRCRKVWIKYLRQHKIHALGDNSIHDRWDAKLAHLVRSLFGDQNSSGRLETIVSFFQTLSDELQQLVFAPREVRYRHLIYSSGTSVSLHLPPRCVQSFG